MLGKWKKRISKNKQQVKQNKTMSKPSATAKIIDGKAIAVEIRAEVKEEVADLVKNGIQPCLAVVLVGDNPASKAYVGSKVRACEETGIKSLKIELTSKISEQDLLAEVDKLNQDKSVHGILVQLPLPQHINEDTVTEKISPTKDCLLYTSPSPRDRG